jgi:hypothetical protein
VIKPLPIVYPRLGERAWNRKIVRVYLDGVEQVLRGAGAGEGRTLAKK